MTDQGGPHDFWGDDPAAREERGVTDHAQPPEGVETWTIWVRRLPNCTWAVYETERPRSERVEVVRLSALLAEREARERAEREVRRLANLLAEGAWDYARDARAEQTEAERDRFRDALRESAVAGLGRIAAGPNMAPGAEPWSKAEALIALGRIEKALASIERARAALSPDPSGEGDTVN